MTEPAYFVPRTGEIVLSDGSKRVLVKGLRDLPDDIANDPAANTYGVKPVHEMTAAERVDFRLPPAAPDVDESARAEVPEVASADPASAPTVQTIHTSPRAAASA